jgi:CDP-paratose 2-epimerase
MSICIVTGSGGLIGSESIKFFANKFDNVIGIDNNLRKYFFGDEASTLWNVNNLKYQFDNYIHYESDIRDETSIKNIFEKYNTEIKLIIHTAAQPSHDWAAKDPMCDFSVNALGTLILLENFRKHCPEAVFIFTSTNKVYGDLPNSLPLIEMDKRWELDSSHKYFANGIDEELSIDNSKHSVFGASKVAADIMVQEYGKYFNLSTGVFRGGCLTGPNHSGAQLHGFLSYLMKCAITSKEYTIFGYKGKQVRDNIHSYDLVNMFYHFYQNPLKGEVFNVGGSRFSNCSILEAIQICEKITGNNMNINISNDNRSGDHIWWISDVTKFKKHYKNWDYTYDIQSILHEIFNASK